MFIYGKKEIYVFVQVNSIVVIFISVDVYLDSRRFNFAHWILIYFMCINCRATVKNTQKKDAFRNVCYKNFVIFIASQTF